MTRPALRAVVVGEMSPVLRDLVLNRVIASALVPRRLRTRLLRAVGHTGIDVTARVNPGVFLGARRGLTLGPRAFINYDCFLDLGAPVTLGPDVGLGYGTMLITCGHDAGPAQRRWGTAVNAPIDIGEGTWVGSRVTILPGVTIGRGCVIASGAVVTADCAPDGLYGGVPARRLRDLERHEGV